MDDLIEDYIERHISPAPDNLTKLERLTNLRLVNGRMCSGHLQGRLLKMIVQMIRPKRVLELGTFSGYSSLCMAEGLTDDSVIDTIEVDDELEDFIRAAYLESPHGHKIRLHIGPALDILASMKPHSFDLVFMDADKREYPADYLAVKPLVRPGGWILADNTLWDGHVVETCRHAPQTEGILRFNRLVADDPDVETVILPLRDGLSIIHVKE